MTHGRSVAARDFHTADVVKKRIAASIKPAAARSVAENVLACQIKLGELTTIAPTIKPADSVRFCAILNAMAAAAVNRIQYNPLSEAQASWCNGKQNHRDNNSAFSG